MLVLLFGLASACAAETNSAPAAKAEHKKEAAKPDSKPVAAKEVAIVKTSEGEMVLEFWPDVAPNHVENFKKLAKKGFYDGTCFHRVIKGFMIQGIDPEDLWTFLCTLELYGEFHALCTLYRIYELAN